MPFKLAHISDIHLGYRSTRHANAQGINAREADGYIALARCVDEIILEECDAVVITGDLFHVPYPSARSIIFAQNQLRKLADSGVTVYVLGGNHDISDKYDELSAARVVDDPHRGIFSSAEPYVVHELADGLAIHLISHHMYGEQAATMGRVKPKPGEINIFATHGSCIDPLLKEKLHTEQSPREIVIPDRLLSDPDWSYTLLGHIHERGWVGSRDKKTDTSKKKIYYNGSLIRRGFSDKEVPLGRGWTLWNISDSGIFTAAPKRIAQRPQFDFKIIDAKKLSSSDLTDRIVANLKLTQAEDQEFHLAVAPILRQRISNISPAKYTAVNWKYVAQQASHALQWSVKQLHGEEITDAEREDLLSNEHALAAGDVIQLYDNWVSSSTKLAEADEELRNTITDQTRRFIQLGQEFTLEQE